MAFTHLRAGEFMHAYFRQVPSIVAQGRLLLPMEDARIAWIDVGDIAEVAATVLTGSGHEGATYPLTGPEALSMADVADKLSAATGNRIEYVNVAPEQATSAQLAAGMPPFTAEALAELFAERRKGKEAQVSPLVQTILGRPATSFDEFAVRHAADVPRRATRTEALTSRQGLARSRSGFHGDPGGTDDEADCAVWDSWSTSTPRSVSSSSTSR